MSSDRPFISFAASPAYGHLFPMLPLADAARRRGARVHVAVGPPFLGSLPFPTVRGSTVDPVATDMRAWTLEHYPAVTEHVPTRWVPTFFGVAHALPAVEALRLAWRADRPDLVVFDTANPGAAVVADELGIPSLTFGVFHYFAPALDLPGVTRRALDDPTTPPWEPLASPPAPRAYIDPVPPALQLGPVATHPARVVPIRTTPWQDPATGASPLPRRRARRPFAYVTFGTVVSTTEVFRSVVAGTAQVADVVASTGPALDPDVLAAMPDTVTAVPFVPAGRVLAEADVVVHHGGLGTTLAAAARGVPQVVVPQVGDQLANANAVTRAEVGVALPSDPTPDDVAQAVRHVLADASVREAARELATRIRAMPAPDAVAGDLIAAVRA